MDTGINYLPKWEQFDFNVAFSEFDKKNKRTHPAQRTKRWEKQYKKYTKKHDEFNNYKGRAINKLLSIESKMDCIILEYFTPNEVQLREHLYQNFFKVSKVEFMNKRGILKNIFQYLFQFPPNKKREIYNKPFLLLERLINYRNTLAHSYYDYKILDSTQKITGAKISTKGKLGNPDVIFDVDFQKEVDNQLWFISLFCEYIYWVLIKKEFKYRNTHNSVLLMLDCPINESDIDDIVSLRKDWTGFFNAIMGNEYGVNKYYKEGKKKK